MRRLKHSPLLTDRLNTLQEEYACYRVRAQPRAHIPKRLRMATLNLVGSGASPQAIEKLCGLHPGQLARWQGRNIRSEDIAAPRVLQVIGQSDQPKSSLRLTIDGTSIIIDLPTMG